MKKLKKILKLLGLVLVIFIGLLYAVNLVPTKLNPEIEPHLQKEKVTFQDKKFIENNEFIHLLKNKDPKSAEDLKIFAEMMTKNPYPKGIRIANTIQLANFNKWNKEHLNQSSSRSEKERLQKFHHSLDFIEHGLKDADTIMHHMIFLNFLKVTASLYGTQTWRNPESRFLKERFENLAEQRTQLLQSALEREFQYQISYAFLLAEDEGWEATEFRAWDQGPFKFLFKPFYDFNATMNSSFKTHQALKAGLKCLETWSCHFEKESIEFHYWKHPKNPVGEALLAVTYPALRARMRYIEESWKMISESVETEAI